MEAIVDLLRPLGQDGAFDSLFQLLQRFYHIVWGLGNPDRHLALQNDVEIVTDRTKPDQVVVLVHGLVAELADDFAQLRWFHLELLEKASESEVLS